MIDLQQRTTFRVPAMARYYYEVDSSDSMREAAALVREYRGNHIVLGGGANILFTKPFMGLVLHPVQRGLTFAQREDGWHAVCGAGWDWDEFVAETIQRGFWGLECLSGIPGTVGASPVQNIGAYGAEVGDSLWSLGLYDLLEDRACTMMAPEAQLGYRDSVFKRECRGRYLIHTVDFKLSTARPLPGRFARLGLSEDEAHCMSSAEIRARVLSIRESKLPSVEEVGSAGSFFKNPEVARADFAKLLLRYPDMPHYPGAGELVKLSAGWLIERCGWKGYREGDAGVWPQQALVLVNYGGASGEDILRLCEKVQEDVLRKTGVRLEPEVNVVGERIV